LGSHCTAISPARDVAAPETLPVQLPFRWSIYSCAVTQQSECHLSPGESRATLPQSDYGRLATIHPESLLSTVALIIGTLNKLLHEGRAASKDIGAVDVVLTVLNAIEWLFA
jgi:hypothetical protein